MPLSKQLEAVAVALHTIAGHSGTILVDTPWPDELDAQAEHVADMARAIATRVAAAEESTADKLAAQVAALEPLVVRVTERLDCGTPWPCAQPVETLRAGLLALEQNRKRHEHHIAELNAENRNLERRLTRAVVDEAAANTRAARAAYQHAEAAVRAAAFDEAIARAISRGKLPPTFRDDLVEWSK